MRRIGFLLFLLILPLSAMAWTPPLGIPAPPWPSNLDIARPTLPSPWASEQAGFYYVDPTGCTDTGRTYGRPGASRCTMPSSPAAGSVIVLNGTISGSKTVNFSGTSGSPIWVLGYNTSSKPVLTGYWDLTGSSYVILDSLGWNYNARDGNTLDGNHIMVRNCTMVNPYDSANGCGFGIGGSFIVYYNNTVSQMGNWQYTGTTDIDRQGIKVYAPAQDVWIVDSLFYHCHSDGVQVGDQNNTSSQINRIYLGRNVAYENFQYGFWVKNATDVIFSQNVVHDQTTNSISGMGGGLGGQYDPNYVWFLNNTVYRSNVGIRVEGGSNNTGGPWFAIGNLLYSIELNGGATCNAWNEGALGFRNSGGFTAIFNTAYDSTPLIGVAAGASTTFRNNIFASKRASCLAVENDGATISHDYNLFSASGYDPDNEAHKVTADPKFVDPANGNFTLQSISPAKDAANPAEESAFATFQNRYGLDIRKDIAGVIRPQGSRWDMGAYEFIQAGTGIPSSPTNLRIQ